MILLANTFIGFGNILHTILSFYTFMILAYVVISWVNADPYNPLVRIINGFCEPVLKFIRRWIRTTIGQIDFAPLLLLLLIALCKQIVAQSLIDYGRSML